VTGGESDFLCSPSDGGPGTIAGLICCSSFRTGTAMKLSELPVSEPLSMRLWPSGRFLVSSYIKPTQRWRALGLDARTHARIR
jgi:hypothetical protein